jgi:hypothetical protein
MEKPCLKKVGPYEWSTDYPADGWVDFDPYSQTYNWNWVDDKGGHTAGHYRTAVEAAAKKGWS